MKLNLGSCDRQFPGFTSVDICAPADVVADLSKPWPWPDSTIEAVRAFHVIEHVADSIHFMNECWRVCKPGARIEIEVPSATHGTGAFQDPTHKSYWTMNTFQYFQDQSNAHKRLAKSYGIRARFKIVEMKERQYQDKYEPVWIICCTLETVK